MLPNPLIGGDHTCVSSHLFLSIMLLSGKKVFDVTQGSSQSAAEGRWDKTTARGIGLAGNVMQSTSRVSCSWILPPLKKLFSLPLKKQKSLCVTPKKKKKKGKPSLHSRIAVFVTSLTNHFIFHIAASWWEFWRSFCCQKGLILSSEMRPLWPRVWSAPPAAAEYRLLSLPQMWRRICCDSPQSWKSLVYIRFLGIIDSKMIPQCDLCMQGITYEFFNASIVFNIWGNKSVKPALTVCSDIAASPVTFISEAEAMSILGIKMNWLGSEL